MTRGESKDGNNLRFMTKFIIITLIYCGFACLSLSSSPKLLRLPA